MLQLRASVAKINVKKERKKNNFKKRKKSTVQKATVYLQIHKRIISPLSHRYSQRSLIKLHKKVEK